MNDQDLRDCFAMFIVNGLISKTGVVDLKEVWLLADAMLEARRIKEEPQGIVSIKKKRNTR
jgi:hypothetical protein